MAATASPNSQLPAVAGGKPVRVSVLPYGRQSIGEDDIAAVTESLRSDWLTTGPKVAEFEKAFAEFCGVREAVAVSNGTAALHAAVAGLGVKAGDEVIVSTITFAASANAAVFQGATPVFADVEKDTLLIDPQSVESKITPRTKGIIAVDYAGQPCDYDTLERLAKDRGLFLLCDACHSVGGAYKNRAVGSTGDAGVFSFHPVKSLTTGEGGMVTTNDSGLAARARRFRAHGVTVDFRQRQEQGTWAYEMTDLGWNYRITDFQCALGITQLRKLPAWVKRRQEIARRYDEAFDALPQIRPLAIRENISHGYHLYVIRIQPEKLTANRAQIFAALRAEGIGVNVHYLPVHLHPFYQNRFSTAPGLCPVAEAAYEEIISLPLFPAMSDQDAKDVVEAVEKVVRHFSRE